MFDHNLLMCTK